MTLMKGKEISTFISILNEVIIFPYRYLETTKKNSCSYDMLKKTTTNTAYNYCL